jgi:sucrose-6-phosphate hydrolase SacC (GH32 family)
MKFLLFLISLSWIYAQTYSAYMMVYFKEGAEELRFSVSDNGFEYLALNENNPVLSSKTIAATGGIRDPHIYRAVDGKTFYLVMTDMVAANGWDSNHGIVMLKSTNLIDWTFSRVDMHTAFPQQFGNVLNMWAPQTIYDAEKKKYMIYWSMHKEGDPNAIYYSYANDNFTALETVPERLFLPDSGSCIDADITYADGVYHLFFKNEQANAIQQAVSTSLTKGYKVNDTRHYSPTGRASEGPCVFRLNNENTYVLIFDQYTSNQYPFYESKDYLNFSLTTRRVTMNYQPKHATVMSITKEERDALVKKWGI